MPRITEMYAYIAEDSGPDDEGVVAHQLPNGFWMPLVGADKLRADSVKVVALAIAKVTGKKITLARFTNRENLEVIQ